MRLNNRSNEETVSNALIFQSMLGTSVERQKANSKLSRQGLPASLRMRCRHRGVEARSKLGSAAVWWQDKQSFESMGISSSLNKQRFSHPADATWNTGMLPPGSRHVRPPNGWNILHTAGDLLTGANYTSGVFGGAQIGMLKYRQALPISSRVIPFSKFAQTFRWMGKVSRGLGGAARFIGAPLSVLMDYNAMQQDQISQTRFIYRTTGTVSSIVSAIYVGAMFGGPYGAAAGLAVGLAFVGGEIAYDVVSDLIDELTQGIADMERALTTGTWIPGF